MQHVHANPATFGNRLDEFLSNIKDGYERTPSGYICTDELTDLIIAQVGRKNVIAHKCEIYVRIDRFADSVNVGCYTHFKAALAAAQALYDELRTDANLFAYKQEELATINASICLFNEDGELIHVIDEFSAYVESERTY
jgi:hypothetical protein